MKRILPMLLLSAPLVFAADPTVVLIPLQGHLYVVEDSIPSEFLKKRPGSSTLTRYQQLWRVLRAPTYEGC
jgi:hypothetical protein